jgi:predicted enzyme related to lactoylglutathione lyase
MGNGVVHFEIMSKDGKRMHEFYSALFGWTIDANNPMNYGVIQPGGERAIGGGIGQVTENMLPYTTFYVAVDNPQQYLDKVVSMGGKVLIPVTDIPGMVTYAMFSDPEGNMVGVVKDMPPPPKAKPARAKKSAKAKKVRKAPARRKPAPKRKKSRR